MDRLGKITLLTLFCCITFGLCMWRAQSSKRVYEQWSRLKSDAPQSQYDTVISYCAAHNQTIKDLVLSFIQGKKDAALFSVQKEWNINWQVLKQCIQAQDSCIAQMRQGQSHGFYKAPKQLRPSLSLIKEILTDHGIRDVALTVKTVPRGSSPWIVFDAMRSEQKTTPHFVLHLPSRFALADSFFQRGNLEHELTHLGQAHGKIVGEVVDYLAQRESCSPQDILASESMQKWMRACEYEADLLPATRSKQTAEQLICALQAVTISDELHPPTRKRIKMLKRIERLHESYEQMLV